MAKFRSIAIMQIDLIESIMMIPVIAIIWIDCNRFACFDQSVAINRSIAIDRINDNYTIYSDYTNQLSPIYFDDSSDCDASIRLVS